jgi:hypothetical protein
MSPHKIASSLPIESRKQATLELRSDSGYGVGGEDYQGEGCIARLKNGFFWSNEEKTGRPITRIASRNQFFSDVFICVNLKRKSTKTFLNKAVRDNSISKGLSGQPRSTTGDIAAIRGIMTEWV